MQQLLLAHPLGLSFTTRFPLNACLCPALQLFSQLTLILRRVTGSGTGRREGSQSRQQTLPLTKLQL